MQILFAITVLCFAGILWAALALARHIKARNLRRDHSSSEVPHIVLQTPVARPSEKPTPTPEPVQHDFRHHFLTAPADVPSRNTRQALNQSVHDIAANKQWTLPPHATQIHRLPLRTVAAPVIASTAPATAPERKPPQSARNGRLELLDPAYFNKDMGDLSDPPPSNNLRANDRDRSNRY
jgi:hypothetical protein